MKKLRIFVKIATGKKKTYHLLMCYYSYANYSHQNLSFILEFSNFIPLKLTNKW